MCRIEEMLAARMKKVNISMLDKLLSICYALMLHWPAAGSEQRMVAGSPRSPSSSPTITSPPSLLRRQAGQTARFPCQVSNLGPVVLIWKHGTRVLTAGVGAGTMLVKQDRRLSLAGTDLVLVNLTREDRGSYTCELDTDDMETLAVTHKLEMLEAPQLVRQPSSGQLVVRRGSSVNLKCQAEGFPEPRVDWSKKNGLLESGLKTQQGPVLTMNNISQYQSGLYTCRASNGVGQPASQHINLTVLYSPVVQAELEMVHSGPGFQAALSCIVTAHPRPTVRWYRDSLLLDSDNNFLLESRGSLHTLIILRVRREQFGQYSCVGSNSLGRARASVRLTGLPLAPVFQSSGVQLVATPSQHSLTWITKSHSPITEYRLQYRKLQQSRQPKVLYVWTHLNLMADKQSGVQANTTYNIDNLEEDCKYEAKVEARNKFGWSNTSDIFQFYSKSEETPKQLPIEPEKTPASSKSGDFHLISSASSTRNMAVVVISTVVFFRAV